MDTTYGSSDSDDSDDHNETIVNGLFGTVNKENNIKSSAVSDCSDDLIMETVDDSKTDNAASCEEMDNESCITIEESVNNVKNDCIEISENDGVISPVLNSKCADSDQLELPSSFATIAKNYENSRSDVILPKGDLPSTLSLLSKNYQDSSSDDDDDDDDVGDVISDIDEKLNDSDNEGSIVSTLKKDVYVKTKGELDISDLPPIEDLKISVDESKCEPVGCVKSIVDTLVIVEAFLNSPALDIDSVLFVDRGQRALGRIFDVFGPVTKPFYAIRFNNNEHIINFNVQIKEPVYCAPKTEYASYVLVSQLMQMKGSDASWRHNNEPPQEFLDYSDDEAEKLAKKNRKQKKCKRSEDSNTNDKSPDSESIARNTSSFSARNTHSSGRHSNDWTQQTASNTHSSDHRLSNWTQHTYSTSPSTRPQSTDNGFGPRSFPTYAQHLRAMEYSHSYRQPYNPWYYNQMYPPAHRYPLQYPRHIEQPPRHNYSEQPPQHNYSEQPLRHNYPEQQLRHNYPNQSSQYNYPEQPPQYNYPEQPPQYNYLEQLNGQNDGSRQNYRYS